MDHIDQCEALRDVKIAASVLKSFFRQLPDPLFTDSRFQAFIDAVPDDSSQNLNEGKRPFFFSKINLFQNPYSASEACSSLYLSITTTRPSTLSVI